MSPDALPDVSTAVTSLVENVPSGIRENWLPALLFLVVGTAVSRVVSQVLGRVAGRWTSPHYASLMGRSTWYGLLALVVTGALRELGFDLSVVLGLAGVATVAVGFAAQTSMSNVISGLFLLVERPFELGDVVRVEQTTGVVTSIDLLSVKLRTFDNLFVRIPNETLVKAELTNLTRYPVRRLDLLVGVDVDADLERVRTVALAALAACQSVLAEPAPRVLFTGVVDQGVTMSVIAWGETASYLELRDEVIVRVMAALRAERVPVWSSRRVVRVEMLGEEHGTNA